MFNVGIKLRKQDKFEVPKCFRANVTKAKNFRLGTASISASFPGGDTRSRRLDCAWPLNVSLEPHRFENYMTGVPSWRYLSLASRYWRFCGDWFVGALGGVEMSFGIIKPPMPQQTSLFNPRVFEAILAESIALQFGKDVDSETKFQRWLVPSCWVPRTRDGIEFACYTAEVSRGPRTESPIYFSDCAIADDLFLSMRVRVLRNNVYVSSNRQPEPDPDAWVSLEPMKDLAERLLSGVHVTLSPQALAQQRAALEGVPNPALCDSFAPLKFV